MLETNPAFFADSTVASGLNTVAKGTYVYVRAWNFGDGSDHNQCTWSFISKPEGSNATLIDVTGLSWWSKFKADSAGTYRINVSVMTSTGMHDTTTTIYSSRYVGTGGFDGVAAQFPNCMSCHGSTPQFIEVFDKWKNTYHATNFKTNITTGSPFFGTSCFKCHTTGTDQNIVAENNGFDDKARDLGWVWSNYSPPKPSNWDSLKNGYPSLVAFAGVGCESVTDPEVNTFLAEGIQTKFREVWMQVFAVNVTILLLKLRSLTQWENSVHSQAIWNSSFAQNNNGSNNLDNCIRCHDEQALLILQRATGQIQTDCQKQIMLQ